MDISFYFCEKPASLRQREVEINTPPPTGFYSRDSPPNRKKYGFTPTTNRKIKKKWRSSSIYIFWLPLYLQTLLIKKNGCKFCQFHLIFFYLKKSARNFIWEKYKISKFLFIMSHTCMTHHFTRDVWALKTSLTLPLFTEVPVPVCPKNILKTYPEAEQHFRRIFSIWLSKF